MNAIKSLLIKLTIEVISYLPFTLSQGLGKSLGWMLWWLPSSPKRIIKTNIALCFPDLSKRKQRRLAHQCMMESMCLLMELSAFWLWPLDCLDGLITTVKGEMHLQAALAKQRGVIVLVPHFGAWEGAQMYFCGRQQGTAMYRPPKIAALDSVLQQMRSRYKDHEYVRADNQGVKQFYSRLKQGKLVFMLPDQVPTEQAILAPFFDVPAQTMRFIFRLIQKTRAEVVFMSIKRLGIGKGFCVEFVESPKAMFADDEHLAATALNATIEQIIKDQPAQYQWAYKRFKRAGPKGQDYYRK